MDINVIYTDDLYTDNMSLSEEKVIESIIENIKDLANTDDRIIYDSNYLIMKGDLRKELRIESAQVDSLISFLFTSASEDDYIEIGKIKINRHDCMVKLINNLEDEEVSTINILNIAFCKNDMRMLCDELVNTQVKFVLLEEIKLLQDELLKNYRNLNWK